MREHVLKNAVLSDNSRHLIAFECVVHGLERLDWLEEQRFRLPVSGLWRLGIPTVFEFVTDSARRHDGVPASAGASLT